MNITLPLNEIHRELEKQHLGGATAKLNGCTVKQLLDCCSISNTLVSRIWNRFVLLISHRVWASDEAISKHLFLNVLWVSSKMADGLLKETFDEKEKLVQVLDKVSYIYHVVLSKKVELNKRWKFLEKTPFYYGMSHVLDRLSQTQALIHADNPKDEFCSSVKIDLKWGQPKSYYKRVKPECFLGLFNYSLFPYEHYVERQTAITAPDFARENLEFLCTQKILLKEESGTIECRYTSL